MWDDSRSEVHRTHLELKENQFAPTLLIPPASAIYYEGRNCCELSAKLFWRATLVVTFETRAFRSVCESVGYEIGSSESMSLISWRFGSNLESISGQTDMCYELPTQKSLHSGEWSRQAAMNYPAHSLGREDLVMVSSMVEVDSQLHSVISVQPSSISHHHGWQ